IETDLVRLIGVRAEGEGSLVDSLLIDAIIVGNGGASSGRSHGVPQERFFGRMRIHGYSYIRGYGRILGNTFERKLAILKGQSQKLEAPLRNSLNAYSEQTTPNGFRRPSPTPNSLRRPSPILKGSKGDDYIVFSFVWKGLEKLMPNGCVKTFHPMRR
nr:villin-1-like isoform X1 [Tanacetum cinerariifolium]